LSNNKKQEQQSTTAIPRLHWQKGKKHKLKPGWHSKTEITINLLVQTMPIPPGVISEKQRQQSTCARQEQIQQSTTCPQIAPGSKGKNKNKNNS